MSPFDWLRSMRRFRRQKSAYSQRRGSLASFVPAEILESRCVLSAMTTAMPTADATTDDLGSNDGDVLIHPPVRDDFATWKEFAQASNQWNFDHGIWGVCSLPEEEFATEIPEIELDPYIETLPPREIDWIDIDPTLEMRIDVMPEVPDLIPPALRCYPCDWGHGWCDPFQIQIDWIAIDVIACYPCEYTLVDLTVTCWPILSEPDLSILGSNDFQEFWADDVSDESIVDMTAPEVDEVFEKFTEWDDSDGTESDSETALLVLDGNTGDTSSSDSDSPLVDDFDELETVAEVWEQVGDPTVNVDDGTTSDCSGGGDTSSGADADPSIELASDATTPAEPAASANESNEIGGGSESSVEEFSQISVNDNNPVSETETSCDEIGGLDAGVETDTTSLGDAADSNSATIPSDQMQNAGIESQAFEVGNDDGGESNPNVDTCEATGNDASGQILILESDQPSTPCDDSGNDGGTSDAEPTASETEAPQTLVEVSTESGQQSCDGDEPMTQPNEASPNSSSEQPMQAENSVPVD